MMMTMSMSRIPCSNGWRLWKRTPLAMRRTATATAHVMMTDISGAAITAPRRNFRTSAAKTTETTKTSTTITTSDVTRDFFEWLEHRYGARFGGRPLPMDDDKMNANANVNVDTNTNTNSNDENKDCEDPVVVTRDSLQLEDLQRLFDHEITVLRVREFYTRAEAASLGKDIANRAKHQQTEAHNWKVSTSKGLESSDVMTTGRHLPYNVAAANRGTESYFEEVRNELRTRRGLPLRSEDVKDTSNNNNSNNNNKNFNRQQFDTRTTTPTLWPLDLLRLELDEVWPVGAGLARAHHQNYSPKCMGGGLPRLMVGPTRWKKGLVHVDELAVLSNETGCFSANIYLQLPYGKATNDCDDDDDDDDKYEEEEEQPVMEIWPLNIRSKWDWYRNAPTLSHLASQDPEGQVILRRTLGDEHKRTIFANPGDLILMCVQRPHCAIGFGHGENASNSNSEKEEQHQQLQLQTRVSLQCFLQYNGNSERLTIDS